MPFTGVWGVRDGERCDQLAALLHLGALLTDLGARHRAEGHLGVLPVGERGGFFDKKCDVVELAPGGLLWSPYGYLVLHFAMARVSASEVADMFQEKDKNMRSRAELQR